MRISIKTIRKSVHYSAWQMSRALQIPLLEYLIYELYPQFIPLRIAKKITNLTGLSIDEIFFR